MSPTSDNPYSAGTSTVAPDSPSVGSLVVSVATVAVSTTITSFLAYGLVGITVETVLLLCFGRYEPLSAILPHSDIAMVYASAFLGGIPLVRLKRIKVPYLAVPIGATLVWGSAVLLSQLPSPWLGLGFAVSTGFMTLIGYVSAKLLVRVGRTCSVRRETPLGSNGRKYATPIRDVL